jgi:hypothetical protein
MTHRPKALRDLERSYRADREAILADESLSWEKKMRKIKDLFEQFSRRRDALLEEEGAA